MDAIIRENFLKYKTRVFINLYQIFYIAFAFFAFFAVLSQSYLGHVIPAVRWANLLQLILVVFSLLVVARKRLELSKWIRMTIIVIIIFLSAISTGEGRFLVIAIFCFAVSKNDLEKVIKFLAYGTLVGIIVVVLAALLGVIPNTISFQTGRHRQALGFFLPVFLPGFTLNLGYAYLFLNRKDVTLKKCLILFIPAAIVYWFTRGRGSFYSLIILTCATYVVNQLPRDFLFKMTVYLASLAKLLFIVFFSLSVYVSSNFFYSEFLQSLDHSATGRLSWFALYWEMYTPTLFGQEVIRVGAHESALTGVQMFILDNAYLSFLLEYGILFTFMIIILIFTLLNYLKKVHDPISILIWITLFVTFLIANTGMFFWRNPLLFQFAYLLTEQKPEEY